MNSSAPVSRWTGALLLSIALSGCVGKVPAIPEDHYYRLPIPAPQPAASRIAGTVGVALPRADGLHSERAVLYSRQDRPLEILRHHYFFWAESPPRLIQDHLIEYLRAARAAEAVVRAEAGDNAPSQIESRLLQFERLVGDDSHQVLVELELNLRRKLGDGRSRRHVYRARAPVADDTVYASVQAFGKALDSIYARFLRDLANE